MLQEMGDKLAASDKSAVENAVEGVKKAIADNDIAGMNRAMDLLTQMQHKAAEALYKSAGAAGAAGGGGAGEPGGAGSAGPAGSSGPQGSTGSQGDVIDAEVVDDK
jgi:molecular chaperone DnaK